MNKTKYGIILFVAGVIGLVVVYSLRPPSGFGEALMMMGQGKQFFIKEPLYQIFLAVAALVALSGVIKIVMGRKGNK